MPRCHHKVPRRRGNLGYGEGESVIGTQTKFMKDGLEKTQKDEDNGLHKVTGIAFDHFGD